MERKRQGPEVLRSCDVEGERGSRNNMRKCLCFMLMSKGEHQPWTVTEQEVI